MAFDGFQDPCDVDAEARLAALHRQAGALVHDFNNLLAVILNAGEALAAHLPEGSVARELAQVSQDAAEQGAQLVARLMDLSGGAETAAVDCAEAVAATARRARLAVPRAVVVETRMTDAPLLAALDRAGLESALLNLCVNAAHAMPHGGRICLTAQSQSLEAPEADALGLTAGSYVVLAVTDTGVGMSPELLAKVMQPFFTTRRSAGGTGLGLPAVRDFAEASGGRLTLESRVQQGSTARLYLPRT